jgi:FKBP-type peptidyl-prolyl cis-trans isomerase
MPATGFPSFISLAEVGRRMDKTQMQKILIPAAAIAGVILLVGLIIATGNSGPDGPSDGKGKNAKPAAGGKFDVFPLDGKEWKELPGGVKYWDVKEGAGEPVPAGAKVTMHYTLWLTNGAQVQTSKGSSPLVSPLGGLIPGWQEAIPGMKAEGVRRLIIPPEKGYGAQDKGDIPPNSTLIFEVELISFK